MQIRKARKKTGLTQTKVANLLGVNQNTYSYWENGKTKIDHFTLAKLAKIFDVSTDFLLGLNHRSTENLLQQFRYYSNITQEELSIISGVPLENIVAWENGSEELSLEIFFDIFSVNKNVVHHPIKELTRFTDINDAYKPKNIALVDTETWDINELSCAKIKYIDEIFALKYNRSNLDKFRIFADDYVIIHKQSYAKNKQVIVVIIDDSIQIRRYLDKNNIIILEAGNEDYETTAFMFKDLKKIKIIGVVSEVIRIC